MKPEGQTDDGADADKNKDAKEHCHGQLVAECAHLQHITSALATYAKVDYDVYALSEAEAFDLDAARLERAYNLCRRGTL